MQSWPRSWNGSSRWCAAEDRATPIPPATFADWTTPRPFALSDLGAGLEGERLEALAGALQTFAVDPSVQALVLYSFGEACGYGSRATGSARPDSDVDLLVVERTPHLEGEAKVAS